MNEPITVKELRAKTGALPRVRLATLPTPLHEVPRSSEAVDGPRISVKRDDLTGLAFGGNKTRMFEFLPRASHTRGSRHDHRWGWRSIELFTAACRGLPCPWLGRALNPAEDPRKERRRYPRKSSAGSAPWCICAHYRCNCRRTGQSDVRAGEETTRRWQTALRCTLGPG